LKGVNTLVVIQRFLLNNTIFTHVDTIFTHARAGCILLSEFIEDNHVVINKMRARRRV
jgi:hypothetical protein